MGRTNNELIAETDVAAWVLPAADFHRLALEHPDLSIVLTNLKFGCLL